MMRRLAPPSPMPRRLRRLRRRSLPRPLALLLLCASCAAPASEPGVDLPPADEVGPAYAIFLVRHAEKADGSRDPELSPPGVERAQLLARMLGEVDFDGIHSSDYRRTRDTAGPVLALREGDLELQLYDPRDLSGMAQSLRATGGTHLVVGHSNTTPALVEALGGEPGDPISETEYSRLYLVSGGAGAPVRTLLLRF